MTTSFYDFQGGYATTVPSPLMNTNEGLTALNCHWDNGIVKRKGYTRYSNLDATFDAGEVVGMIRSDISGSFESIVALNTSGSGLTFWHGEDTMAQIGSTEMNESQRVEFVQLGSLVLGVSGTDYPFIITYSDPDYSIQYIEQYDSRVRSDREWHAVTYHASTYTDVTDDVQNPLVSTNLTDGSDGSVFYISCDFTFNTVGFSGLSASGAVSVTYEYSKRDTWVAFTPTEEPDWANGVDGNIAFDLPFTDEGELDMEVSYDTTLKVSERYAIRVTFSGAHVGITADQIAVGMDQYLRLIMGGEYGHDICIHNSRIQIASGNVVNFSPVNSARNWRSDEVEYFQDGGHRIQKMVSFPNALAVFKEDAIYMLTGNSYQTYNKRKITKEGTIAPRSVVVMDQEVYYLSRDGIRGWNGTQSVVISKHIHDEIPMEENACAINYERNYWISFPSAGILLRFDPDTAVRRDNGDATVGFFKYNNYGMTNMVYAGANADTRYVYGVKDGFSGIFRLDDGDTDNGSDISMDFKTLYFTFENKGAKKRMGRIKPEVEPAGDYILSFESDDGLRTASTTLASGTTGTTYTEEVSLPYTLDGRNIAFRLQHTGAGGRLRALHVEQYRRAY